MAIANFFDKISLGAAQILNNYDQQGFKDTLLSQHILVCYDNNASQTYEGKVSLNLLIRMLARLYPNIQIEGCTDNQFTDELKALANQINPEINLSKSETPTICIVVGKTKANYITPTFYIGSDSWVSKFSNLEPLGCSSSNNPLGAAAASCIGVANLFRYVFSKHLPYSSIDEPFALSLFDYTYTEKNAGVLLPPMCFEDVLLVGLGAIGNSVTWLLSNITDISGKITLIDHEPISLSNLQRYILADQNCIGRQKVEVADRFLKKTKLSIESKPNKWDEYISFRGNSNIKTIATCIDNAADRILIQGILPKKIYNAWTQQENLGVSRHTDFVNTSCLCCLYFPTEAKKSRSQEIADNLNLSEHEKTIRLYLANHKPVDQTLLNLIETANQVPINKLNKFLNCSVDIFYSEVVCGGILLSLQNSENKITNQNMEVPSVFESTFAGILLASELIKDSLGYVQEKQVTTTRFNLIRSKAEYLNFVEEKRANCICQDDIFRQVFTEKWVL